MESRTFVRVCQFYIIYQYTVEIKACHQVKNNYKTTMFSTKFINNLILIGLPFEMTNNEALPFSKTTEEEEGEK